MAMKEAEMGTELIDHLTPEEKVLLSRLNPEITDLKERLITCKTDRIEVSKGNLVGGFVGFHVYMILYVHILSTVRLKQEKLSLRLI